MGPSVQRPPPPEPHERCRPGGPAGPSPVREAPRDSAAAAFGCPGPERAPQRGLRHLPQGPHQGQPRPPDGERPRGAPPPLPCPFPAPADPDPEPRTPNPTPAPDTGTGTDPGPDPGHRAGPLSSPGLTSVLLHLAQPHRLPARDWLPGPAAGQWQWRAGRGAEQGRVCACACPAPAPR